jgi:hypothetical protein
MKRFISIIFALVLLATIASVGNADENLSGNLSDITSVPEGLLIKLDTGVTPECEGAPYGWMLVKEENLSMVSVVLTLWALEKRGVSIYTKPLTGRFCEVIQVDPFE